MPASKDVIICRSANPDDLSALLKLYRSLNPADPVLSEKEARTAFEAMRTQPGLTVFVAVEQNAPVATATLAIIPNLTRSARPYALIENVVTLESHRGRGFGQAVVRHAAQAGFLANCYKVMLLTGRQRPVVHAFYERCGFQQNKTGFQMRRD